MLGALILASGILSTVDVGARSEMRVRVAPTVLPQGGLGPASTGVDILLTPYARFEAKTRHLEFKLGDAALEHQSTRRVFLVPEGEPTAATSTIRPCNKSNGGPAPLLPDKSIDPDPAVCAPDEQWGALREVWRHRITRRIMSEVAAGGM